MKISGTSDVSKFTGNIPQILENIMKSRKRNHESNSLEKGTLQLLSYSSTLKVQS